jgi:hypothetical protein
MRFFDRQNSAVNPLGISSIICSISHMVVALRNDDESDPAKSAVRSLLHHAADMLL